MIEKHIATTVDELDELFAYWMLAKERGEAIKTLQKALKIDPSIERYLQLARLQMDEQQWEDMKKNVLAACNMSLPDEYVSKANLLLGISELKQGNHAAARSAFINATLVGGEGETARQYLDYMEAENATEQENEMFHGPCTPKWARKQSVEYSVGIGKKDTLFSENVDDFGKVDRVDYKIKTSPSQNMVVGSYTIPAVEMEKKILPNALKLGMFIARNGGHIDGNMHFIFPQPVKVGDEIINFSMAFPVSKKPLLLGRYHLLKDKGFKSASTVFEGPAKNLFSTWINFHNTVLKDGLSLTGESRQIILDSQHASKEHIKMELQLGVK